MAIETKIEWADHTWSPWRSCQHADLPDGTPHPGCLNCYAEAMAKRNQQVMGVWGTKGTRVVAAPISWKTVRSWNADCRFRGATESVFPSFCDPFEDWPGPMHDTRGRVLSRCQDCLRIGDFEADSCPCGSDDVPGLTMSDVRSDLMSLIDETHHLNWILLTKRPHNVITMLCETPGNRGFNSGVCRHNTWLLYSASDQRSLEAGIESLIGCRNLFAVTGVCLGPLIGLVDMRRHIAELDWVIIEGESGAGARPCALEWIRDAIAQCQAAHVPCFHKQLGAHPLHHGDSADARAIRTMKHPKGGDMSEWPEDLRIRQMPDPVPF